MSPDVGQAPSSGRPKIFGSHAPHLRPITGDTGAGGGTATGLTTSRPFAQAYRSVVPDLFARAQPVSTVSIRVS